MAQEKRPPFGEVWGNAFRHSKRIEMMARKERKAEEMADTFRNALKSILSSQMRATPKEIMARLKAEHPGKYAEISGHVSWRKTLKDAMNFLVNNGILTRSFRSNIPVYSLKLRPIIRVGKPLRPPEDVQPEAEMTLREIRKKARALYVAHPQMPIEALTNRILVDMGHQTRHIRQVMGYKGNANVTSQLLRIERILAKKREKN